MTTSAAEYVNLTRYPLDNPESPRSRELIKDCQEKMRDSGVCQLTEFLTPDAVATMRAEAEAIEHHAFFCHNTHNSYLAPDDASFPEDHPRRMRHRTDVGSVPYDRIDESSALRSLYLWKPLVQFVARVLEREQLHYFADPLGALSINVFRDGGGHAWHFDEAEFTNTIMLQPAEEGGLFEYVANIRTPGNENYEAVAQVLAGNYPDIQRLPFEPGSFLLFAGQNTIHRVTEVRGSHSRLVPVLCYTEQPGMTNTDEVRKLFWGRTGYEAA